MNKDLIFLLMICWIIISLIGGIVYYKKINLDYIPLIILITMGLFAKEVQDE